MDLRVKLIELERNGLACPGHLDPFGDHCEACHYYDSKECDLEWLADHLIANGVTVQDVPDINVGKWIPVTERLPEDDLSKGSTAKQIKVIVAYKRSNCSWVIRTQLRQKGRWYGRPNEWDWSVSDPISYWMPLPEPPKGD